MKCCVCDTDRWLPIPDPVAGRSITTAGVLLDEPLTKGQCANCGLIQRIAAAFVGESDFYEERYGNYYRRPGAQTYDAPRYEAMAQWLHVAVTDLDPASILDVGCGAGWSMMATRKRFPHSRIEGVEPSRANAALARQAGFDVHIAKIGEGRGPQRSYDLIFANN